MHILELENITTKIKSSMMTLTREGRRKEERIDKLKDREIEINQCKQQREN